MVLKVFVYFSPGDLRHQWRAVIGFYKVRQKRGYFFSVLNSICFHNQFALVASAFFL